LKNVISKEFHSVFCRSAEEEYELWEAIGRWSREFMHKGRTVAVYKGSDARYSGYCVPCIIIQHTETAQVARRLLKKTLQSGENAPSLDGFGSEWWRKNK